jgi:predicted DNA-binding transcriptional regulator YafY
VSKVSTLERLRNWLQEGHTLTYAELTSRIGLSERQLARHMQQLRDEGYPIIENRQGKHKTFALPPERQQVAVPDLRFDNAELRALTVAAKASRSMLAATPHAAALGQAFDKLLAHARPVAYLFDVDEPLNDWHFDDQPADPIAPDSFHQLEIAMDARQPVYIDYFTAGRQRHSHQRKVDPYNFYKRGRSWIMVGYCHERRALRNFALPRISQVTPCLEEHFEILNGFDPERYFAGSLGAFTAGETYTLRLLVESDRASYFRERQYHHTQIIEEGGTGAERSDNRLIVSYELEGLDELRSFCQSWGTGITVLEPAELRELLRHEAEVLAARYQ